MDKEQKTESATGIRYNIIIHYPEGVEVEDFKDYLSEVKKVDLGKLEKYFKALDTEGKCVVLTSDDEEKLKKAISAFVKLGFRVFKELCLELAEDDNSFNLYRCPVCDTASKRDEFEHAQPCSVCGFLHLPDLSTIYIMKKRIEWEEFQQIKKRKENKDTVKKDNRLEEQKRKLEEKLRKEIRAELMKKYNLDEDGNKKGKAAAASILGALAVIIFVLGYNIGEKMDFNRFFNNGKNAESMQDGVPEFSIKPKIKIEQEQFAAMLEKAEQKEVETFRFEDENGINMQPKLIGVSASLSKSPLVYADSNDCNIGYSIYSRGGEIIFIA